jgi:iron complex outermembrane receptor protein
MPVTPSEIERIEIIKGPAAAMYGSEAVGGVINIITKTFFRFKKEKSKLITTGISTGEYGLTNTNLGLYKSNPKINYALGVLSNNADGQILRSQKRGYFYNHTFSGSANIPLGKNWLAGIQSSFDSRDFAAENYYTTFTSDTATEKVKTWWSHTKLKRTKNNKTDQIDFTYKKTNDFYLYNPASIANENESNLSRFQYIHTKSNPNKFDYVYGLLLENKKIISNDRGNHSNNHAAAFASAVYHYKNLNINGGLRLVNDQNYGNEILPQLNLSYQLNQITLRAGAGKAIRAADFTERFNNYNKALVKGGSVGNPDLMAEKSWSYEVGSDFNLKELKINTTAFYRNQTSLIDFVNTPYSEIPRNTNLSPTGTFNYAKNIKTVNTRGIEIEANYSKVIKKSFKISLSASMSIIDSKTSDSIPSYYILSHAKKIIQQTLILNYKNIQASFNSIYKERSTQAASKINATLEKSYWLCNLKMQYGINKANIFITINNIGDIKYSDLLGSQMPGSWLTGGFSVNID